MPKASAVAAELRKLADSLDMIDPAVDMPYVFVVFSHKNKESFLASARQLPRPLKKKVSCPGEKFAEVKLEYKSDAMHIWSQVPQSLTCTLVEPAKPAIYKCEPILSPEEDAELEVG